MRNRQYVYQTRSADNALVVILNADDEPLRMSLPELGIPRAELLAGSAAPPQAVTDEVLVEGHGWRILQPA
ncbi:hypothetical protein MSHO_41120 [Mycobacterium shottsii]|uniref:Maltogenic Amylase C-terminal domain-containing protein n=1 Tax=Mycobacterium shottsii TaxID=133549 RepID=A0A7I7LGP3_9MYCO|nr:hypothetical protein MSHO_41120 [Mycobacterium shottsii]